MLNSAVVTALGKTKSIQRLVSLRKFSCLSRYNPCICHQMNKKFYPLPKIKFTQVYYLGTDKVAQVRPLKHIKPES